MLVCYLCYASLYYYKLIFEAMPLYATANYSMLVYILYYHTLTSMSCLSSEGGGELQSGTNGGPAVLQPAGVERKHY